jgi:hypothetical protein
VGNTAKKPVCQIRLQKIACRLRLKCDGTRAETRFRLSAKRTSPFKSAGASVQSTAGSRGVRISGSNDGYTMFRGSVKSTGYPLHSPVSPSLPLPCATVCHHISIGLYSDHDARKVVGRKTNCHRLEYVIGVQHISLKVCICYFKYAYKYALVGTLPRFKFSKRN